MEPFNTELFARQLLAESLFYDEEYGALGNLSLVDAAEGKERYIGSFMPDDGTFVIEEATEWEAYEGGEDDEVGYALAIDSDEYATYETPEETAEALMELAREHDLQPSITLLFEDEVV